MKKVLVTGGAKGIGAACCRAFSNLGYFVLINYFKSKKEAEKLKEEIIKNGGVCEIFSADLTNFEEAEEMFLKIEKEFGFVDVLINNAAVSQYKLFSESSLKDWKNVFNVNLFAMFFCTKKVLASMIKQKRGKIINISSIWGEVGASFEVVYSSSKAAVIGFTKALAKEVALSGINVNCIAPGVIKTEMLKELNEKELNELIKKIPSEKIGVPEDVANAALFLADEKSSYINGEVLNVGGGFCKWKTLAKLNYFANVFCLF